MLYPAKDEMGAGGPWQRPDGSGSETLERDEEREFSFQRLPLVKEMTSAAAPNTPQAIVAPPGVLAPELIVLDQGARLHLKLPDDLTQEWLARQSIKLRPGDCWLNTAFVASEGAVRAKKGGVTKEGTNEASFRLLPKTGATDGLGPEAQSQGSPLPERKESKNKFYSRYVLLSDQKSKMVLGVARADAAGKFICNDFPSGRTVELSTEETLPSETKSQDRRSVYLVQQALGSVTLRVEPGQAAPKGKKTLSVASQGLLLRIARRKQNLEIGNSASQAAPLVWNWLRNNHDSTMGLRIDSYFQQTFLVRSDLVEIALPAGPYLFALTNPITNMTCFVAAEIESGKSSELSCPEKKIVSDDFNRKSSQSDDRPIFLIPTHAGDDALGNQLGIVAGSGLLLAELSHSGTSAVIHADLSPVQGAQKTGRPGSNTQSGASDYQREQIVLDGSFSDLKDISLAPSALIEKYLTGTQIPDLAVNSQVSSATQDEAKYFNPLYTQTRLMLSNNRGLAADSIHTSVTNGVTFRWRSIDPRSSLVPMPSDGVLNFEILIPAYNLTEFIEVHVNGALKRRIVLGRKNIAEPAVINVEERFNTKSDADVSLYAWGRPFLPEFLYGQTKISPRAISSRICLDVNKNYICDLIPERTRP